MNGLIRHALAGVARRDAEYGGDLGEVGDHWTSPSRHAAQGLRSGASKTQYAKPATPGPPATGPLETSATMTPTDLGAYWAQRLAVSREQP